MTQWMFWMSAALVVVILEIFSGTFYLLMMAIGLAAGALVAYFGGALEIQLVTAAVVGMLATLILRQARGGRTPSTVATRDPNINLDIGQSISVDAWINPFQANQRATARVLYRGAMWDVECADLGMTSPGQFIIRELRGSRLIVSRSAD